jgi:hypothetical protein
MPLKIIQLIIIIISLGKDGELQKDQVIIPGISIYKTKGNYFDLVDIGIKGDRIFRRSSFSNDNSKISISNTDTVYKARQRLVNGYVLDYEADVRYDVFLNLTYKEHIILEKKCGRTTLPDDTLIAHIIDKDPYLEFYRDVKNLRKFGNTPDNIDTSAINKIILDGKIKQFFKKLK